MKKTFLATLAAALCAVLLSSVCYAGDIYMNKIPLGASVETVTKDEIVYVPLRDIANIAGAKLDWDDKTKTATVYNPFSIEKKVLAKLTVGDTTAIIHPVDQNGRTIGTVFEQTLEGAPFILDSKMYLPLNFVAESLGYNATFDEGTGDIQLNS